MTVLGSIWHEVKLGVQNGYRPCCIAWFVTCSADMVAYHTTTTYGPDPKGADHVYCPQCRWWAQIQDNYQLSLWSWHGEWFDNHGQYQTWAPYEWVARKKWGLNK